MVADARYEVMSAVGGIRSSQNLPLIKVKPSVVEFPFDKEDQTLKREHSKAALDMPKTVLSISAEWFVVSGVEEPKTGADVRLKVLPGITKHFIDGDCRDTKRLPGNRFS